MILSLGASPGGWRIPPVVEHKLPGPSTVVLVLLALGTPSAMTQPCPGLGSLQAVILAGSTAVRGSLLLA